MRFLTVCRRGVERVGKFGDLNGKRIRCDCVCAGWLAGLGFWGLLLLMSIQHSFLCVPRKKSRSVWASLLSWHLVSRTFFIGEMAVIYPAWVSVDPSREGLSEGSGMLIVTHGGFHVLSPRVWASLRSFILSRRVPALVSPLCFISFCFEQIGEQRATELFQGLALVAGAGRLLPVDPESPKHERDGAELLLINSWSAATWRHSQPSVCCPIYTCDMDQRMTHVYPKGLKIMRCNLTGIIAASHVRF